MAESHQMQETRQESADIQVAAMEGAQSAVIVDRENSPVAETPFTPTSAGTSAISDADAKSARSDKFQLSSADGNAEQGAKVQGSGHWLQKDKQVLPYNNMKIVMPGICLIVGKFSILPSQSSRRFIASETTC